MIFHCCLPFFGVFLGLAVFKGVILTATGPPFLVDFEVFLFLSLSFIAFFLGDFFVSFAFTAFFFGDFSGDAFALGFSTFFFFFGG